MEHSYAAKQHLVHCIQGTHTGELERGMLTQWPMLDNTCSNRYQVSGQVNNVKTYFNQSAQNNIAELYDLHCFESATECLEFIDSLLADNKYLISDSRACGRWCKWSKSNTERVHSC
jgi:hypothetical protein